jgi:hypothetical protein
MPVPDQVRDERSGIHPATAGLDAGFRRNDNIEGFGCRNNIFFSFLHRNEVYFFKDMQVNSLRNKIFERHAKRLFLIFGK